MGFERMCWKWNVDKFVGGGNGWAQDGFDKDAWARPTYGINTEC